MHRDRLKLPIIIVSVLLVIAIAFGVFLWLDKFADSGSVESGTKAKEHKYVYFDGTAYQRKNIVTYLLIGIDEFGEAHESGSYNNTQQADFLALLVVNKTDKTYSIIHINRDTMTNVKRLAIGGSAGYAYEQIALAHTYGSGLEDSCKNTVDAVSRLLGRGKDLNGKEKEFEIDYYVSLTMDAVAKANDFLGGVTLTLDEDEDLTEINEKWIPGATVTLMGDDALNFVRARMEVQDGTNISRMKRQRHYIEELIKQQQGKVYSYSFASDLYNEIKEYMVTNCSLSNFDDFIGYISAYQFTETFTPEGEARVGAKFMEFYVDEAKLDELMREKFYEKRD